MRECVSDLAPVLWHSCGTISVLIQVPQTRFTMFTVWQVGGNTGEYWWVKKIHAATRRLLHFRLVFCLRNHCHAIGLGFKNFGVWWHGMIAWSVLTWPQHNLITNHGFHINLHHPRRSHWSIPILDPVLQRRIWHRTRPIGYVTPWLCCNVPWWHGGKSGVSKT